MSAAKLTRRGPAGGTGPSCIVVERRERGPNFVVTQTLRDMQQVSTKLKLLADTVAMPAVASAFRPSETLKSKHVDSYGGMLHFLTTAASKPYKHSKKVQTHATDTSDDGMRSIPGSLDNEQNTASQFLDKNLTPGQIMPKQDARLSAAEIARRMEAFSNPSSNETDHDMKHSADS